MCDLESGQLCPELPMSGSQLVAIQNTLLMSSAAPFIHIVPIQDVFTLAHTQPLTENVHTDMQTYMYVPLCAYTGEEDDCLRLQCLSLRTHRLCCDAGWCGSLQEIFIPLLLNDSWPTTVIILCVTQIQEKQK